MTYKLTTLLSSTTSLLSPKALKLSLVSLGVLTATQHLQAAEQEWWFDVEVILFERTLEPNAVSEKFKQSSLTPKIDNTLDILSPYLTPDTSYLLAGLHYCRASKREEVSTAERQRFVIPNMQWVENLSTAIDELLSPEPELESDLPALGLEVQSVSTNPSSFIDSQNVNVTGLSTYEDNESEPYVSQLTDMSYIEWQIPEHLPCAYSEQIDPMLVSTPKKDTSNPTDLITKVPVKIDGIEWQTKMPAFLLPVDTFRMEELYQSIKYQKGITPLLHLAWRQEVTFGRENTQAIRLFAGKNYGHAYTNSGELIPQDTDTLFDALSLKEKDVYIPEAEKSLDIEPVEPEITSLDIESTEDLFRTIDNALDDSTPVNLTELLSDKPDLTEDEEDSTVQPSDIWQLDGEVAVYLRNIGRVPYLHIDSDLDYRHPVFKSQESMENSETTLISGNYEQANFLESVNFDQLRRVISKQVHYFDHPLFGMVVTINRYNWSEIEEPKKE
ncbi:CsiV family protein [uncultured Paraglaciecola sp.]|uniref:CsiV family protein n=1 Tax=uncultured Paraglaciecola sp. TaxID=1765024 RepID=UPI002592E724|nr:CsiV family protein [uncultured Paraglaciecola sp.]